MADEPGDAPRPRPFWSGTISFGLVSVPVELYAAVRSRRAPLRQLGPEGRPLRRQYFCSADGTALGSDDIVRGYPGEEGGYVVVSDEELDALEPNKSRDIDLRRFVDVESIDRRLLDRPYILAPAGESTKAYHLLAETMERSGRAGIATFVMRGNEYLAAILAEGGVLRAFTLRFIDELRSPEDVGLPEPHPAEAARRREIEAALDALEADELDTSLLRDESTAELVELAERKRAASRDVIAVSGEEAGAGPAAGLGAEVIDLMQVLKQRLGISGSESKRTRASSGPRTRAASADALARESKKQLYERAKRLAIPGRSSMSKDELIEAIRTKSASM